MTFERSKFGIQNRAQFANVEAVLYVEGEPSKSIDHYFDSIFWRQMFSVMFPALRIEVRPLGNKSRVLTQAKLIVGGDIQRSFVAIDLDYDDLCAAIEADDRVFYTHGYSVENDILDGANLRRYVYRRVGGDQRYEALAEEYEAELKSLLLELKWASIADQISVSRGCGTLDRDKPGRYFLTIAGSVRINRKNVVRDLRSIKSKCAKKASITLDFDVRRRLVGKILIFGAYQLYRQLCSRHSLDSPRFSEFIRDLCFEVGVGLEGGIAHLLPYYQKSGARSVEVYLG